MSKEEHVTETGPRIKLIIVISAILGIVLFIWFRGSDDLFSLLVSESFLNWLLLYLDVVIPLMMIIIVIIVLFGTIHNLGKL